MGYSPVCFTDKLVQKRGNIRGVISLEQIEVLRMKREEREMEAKTFDTLPPIKYDENIAGIAKLKKEYMPLVITDLDDKEQFDTVHDARMVMVKLRTNIERQRKAQKASALEHGRNVDKRAGELTDLSIPIETHLQTEEDKVTKEKERIKAEEDRLEKEKIQGRVDALQEYNVVLPYQDVASMNDGVFIEKLDFAKTEFEAAEQAKADEATRLTEAQAEIDRKAIEQAARDKEVAEKEEGLRIEREAFEAEKWAAKEKKDREAFEAKAKEDARIQAEKDSAKVIEDARIAAEEAETARLLQEATEKAEAERQEALKPDKEKLIAWAETIASLVEPDVQDARAKVIVDNGGLALAHVAETIIKKAEEL